MIRDTADDKGFADELDALLAQRAIVKQLFALRSARGVSQAELASKMECSQSRISKLESGSDADLRLGDFAAYLDALDLDVRLVVQRKNHTLADQVKYHAFNIKRIVDRMATLAGDDAPIAAGVFNFIRNAAANLEHFLRDSANKLKLPMQATPRISIEVEESECDEEEKEVYKEKLVAL